MATTHRYRTRRSQLLPPQDLSSSSDSPSQQTPNTSASTPPDSAPTSSGGSYRSRQRGEYTDEKYSNMYYYQMLADSRKMARENVEDIVDAEGKPTVAKLSKFRWRDVYTLVQIPSSTSPDQAVKMEENDAVRPKAQVWRAPKKLTAVLEEKDIPSYVSRKTHQILQPAKQLLYQPDEIDVRWLKLCNAARVENGQARITMHQLAHTLNTFESEAYTALHCALIQSLALPARFPLPDDDAKCIICGDREYAIDAVKYNCVMCNMTCHAECLLMGTSELPGDWKCSSCEKLDGRPPNCVLCPMRGGGFMETTDGRWAHLNCGKWFWNCRYSGAAPHKLDCRQIPLSNWSMKCQVCNTSLGACLQCQEPGCDVSFHVSCALRTGHKFYTTNDKKYLNYHTYCLKHTLEVKGKKRGKKKSLPGELENNWVRSEELGELEKYLVERTPVEDAIRLSDLPADIIKELFAYWKLKRQDNGYKPLIQEDLIIVADLERLVLERLSLDEEEDESTDEKRSRDFKSSSVEKWATPTASICGDAGADRNVEETPLASYATPPQSMVRKPRTSKRRPLAGLNSSSR